MYLRTRSPSTSGFLKAPVHGVYASEEVEVLIPDGP